MSLAAVPDEGGRRRPRIKTFQEVKAEARPPFRVPGLVHSALTGIVGEPYVGKSGLVANLVASGLNRTDFLGTEWSEAPDHVVLVLTDAGAAREYAERLDALGVAADETRLSFMDDAPTTATEWAAVRADLSLTAASVVVLDNLTGFIPDVNSTKDAYSFFAIIEKELCHHGVSVVLVAHKSEKSGPYGKSRAPMGTTAISARLRHVVYADHAAGGGVRLTTRGNECEEQLVMTLERRGHAAAFAVTAAGPARKPRSTAALDRNASMAAWVVENCQGKNKTQTAEALVGAFGGSPGAHAKALQPTRPLGMLVRYDPQASSWARAG